MGQKKLPNKCADRLFNLAALTAAKIAVDSDNSQVKRFDQNVLDLMEEQETQIARMIELSK